MGARAAEAPPSAAPVASAPKQSWLQRLRLGLSRSSTTIARGVTDIFTKRKLDAASLDDLEDVLIQADLGLAAASRIREAVAHGRYERGISPEEVKQILADEVERALEPVARPLVIDPDKRPFVILVVGVNGSGKTTTIGKLAAKFRAEGKAVLLAAGDTFRAAAIEQLRIWARRTFSAIVERDQGADAAGLAFDALTRARELNVDVVLMDTAGRLQNRTELMSELEKIIRVMKKVDADAPHAVLLVLDATVGQNALSQVEIFGRDCRRHRPRDDQARRHRARRHSGGDRRQIRAARPFHWRRRGRRRSRAVRRARLRRCDRRDRERGRMTAPTSENAL